MVFLLHVLVLTAALMVFLLHNIVSDLFAITLSIMCHRRYRRRPHRPRHRRRPRRRPPPPLRPPRRPRPRGGSRLVRSITLSLIHI